MKDKTPMKTVTERDIFEGLRGLDVAPGDKIVVHSSLSSMGRVDGGAETVVNAFLASVAPGGTVLVPVMTFGVPFDPRTTESKCGAITEAFRRRPEALRSLSPTHSIAGIGPDAERLLDGHERALPFGPNGPDSPLGKLADEGGKIVLLGVTHVSNTIVHIVLYRAELPALEEWRGVDVTDSGGGQRIVNVQHPGCSLGFDALEPYLMEKNAQKIAKIGNADVRCMKASDVIEIGLAAVKEHPALLLCDRPDCRFCSYTRGKVT